MFSKLCLSIVDFEYEGEEFREWCFDTELIIMNLTIGKVYHYFED